MGVCVYICCYGTLAIVKPYMSLYKGSIVIVLWYAILAYTYIYIYMLLWYACYSKALYKLIYWGSIVILLWYAI